MWETRSPALMPTAHWTAPAYWARSAKFSGREEVLVWGQLCLRDLFTVLNVNLVPPREQNFTRKRTRTHTQGSTATSSAPRSDSATTWWRDGQDTGMGCKFSWSHRAIYRNYSKDFCFNGITPVDVAVVIFIFEVYFAGLWKQMIFALTSKLVNW